MAPKDSVVFAWKENRVPTTQVPLNATKHLVYWRKAVSTDDKGDVYGAEGGECLSQGKLRRNNSHVIFLSVT